MKANELRLGNYKKHGNDIVIVSAIFKSHFICETKDGIVKGNSAQERFESIALTPEILEKCGFVDRKLDNFYFFENGNLIIEGYEHDYNGIFIGNSVAYLHQLQNLYFALTGTELEITL